MVPTVLPYTPNPPYTPLHPKTPLTPLLHLIYTPLHPLTPRPPAGLCPQNGVGCLQPGNGGKEKGVPGSLYRSWGPQIPSCPRSYLWARTWLATAPQRPGRARRPAESGPARRAAEEKQRKAGPGAGRRSPAHSPAETPFRLVDSGEGAGLSHRPPSRGEFYGSRARWAGSGDAGGGGEERGCPGVR